MKNPECAQSLIHGCLGVGVQLIWNLTIMNYEENLKHGGCRSVCSKEGCGGDPTRSVSQQESETALGCSWRARPAIKTD